MILVPRDNEGGKQSLATLDVMAPGISIVDRPNNANLDCIMEEIR